MYSYSIIVPIYNAEKSLSRCIESIIQQEFVDFELVLVDDCSVDSSFSICEYFANRDYRIKLIHLEKNLGLLNAREVGFANSCGEYLCWVDADDYIGKARLKKINSIIEQTDVDMVITGWTLVNRFGRSRKINDSIEYGVYRGDVYERMKPQLLMFEKKRMNRMISPNIWSKVMKRSLFMLTSGKIDSELKIGEDAVRSYSALMAASSIAVIDDNSYFYIQHPGQMTRRYYRDYYEKACWIYDFIFDLVKSNLLCKYSIDESLRQNLCHVAAYGAISAYGSHATKKTRMQALETVKEDFVARGLDVGEYDFEFFLFRWILDALASGNMELLYFLAQLYCLFS